MIGQAARLGAIVGVIAGLTISVGALAQPQTAPAAPETKAAAPVQVAQTPPAAQPGTPPAAQPGTPPAGQPGTPPADGDAPPPPPTLGPDGQPVLPPADGTTPPAVDATTPPAAPPAPEEPKVVHDMSPLGMFLMATVVVQAVMVWLVLASILTWALLFSKLAYFSGLNSTTDRVLREFRDSNTLQQAASKMTKAGAASPVGQMLLAAVDEMKASGAPSTGEKRQHLTDRLSARMAIAQSASNEEIGSGMQIFATTGAIAPFVGLFGTVWGIMNSFIGIAQSQTTNLAVVAPGIAEALFATAIGLFAAIPAVIFYNIFARRIGAYNTRLENFSGEVLVRLSRQLDAGA